MTENDLLNLVMDWLKAQRVMAWRNNSTGVFDPVKRTFRRPSKHSRNGVPDILGFLPGGIGLGIELKKPPQGKRRPGTLWNMCSQDQQDFITEAQALGVVCFVADDLETVKTHLSPLLPGAATG